jgi:selenocysteine lyase/cysteine desulfurase
VGVLYSRPGALDRLPADRLSVQDPAAPYRIYAARPVQALGLAERGGLLRTGISMYNTRDELNRLLTGLERLA